MHPTTRHLLSLFDYEHLPPHLQETSRPLSELAHGNARTLLEGPELWEGLRKLVEAKDCLVRQAVADQKFRTDHQLIPAPDKPSTRCTAPTNPIGRHTFGFPTREHPQPWCSHCGIIKSPRTDGTGEDSKELHGPVEFIDGALDPLGTPRDTLEVQSDEQLTPSEVGYIEGTYPAPRQQHPALADAWQRGYTAGQSITRRRWSDEPNAEDYPNPHAIETGH